MAVLTPMPNVSVNSAVAANAGFLRSDRAAKPRSLRKLSMVMVKRGWPSRLPGIQQSSSHDQLPYVVRRVIEDQQDLTEIRLTVAVRHPRRQIRLRIRDELRERGAI